MRRLSLTAFATALSLAILSLFPGRACSAPASIPDVHFAVFRFAASTQTLVGLYEFSQPYRKSLPDPGYAQSTNLLYGFSGAGDFGGVDVESRLTGERVLSATTIWIGTGTFDYPPASMMSTTLLHGFTNAPPEAVISPGIPYATDVNAAWALVQDTDAIARLATHGTYEVYAWMHMYADGGAPPLNEIFIIAASHPVAPKDMAVLQVAWPRSLVTRGLPVTPEVVVHNFGDAPTDLQVRMDITPGARDYQQMQPIGVLPADQSRTVMMPPLFVYGDGVRTINCTIRTFDGHNWSDVYPSNDAAQEALRITDQPVFRSSSMPRDGLPCDFDDDGDTDIVTFYIYLQFWQNDGTGQFVDVTGLSSLPAILHPRDAVCGDFNGDDHADLFVSYWYKQGLMLAGSGSGGFTDVTLASGLAGVITYHDMLAIDKENDGDLDIVIAVQGQETIVENDGSGHFTNVTTLSGIVDTRDTSQMAQGDLNGDGYPDLAFANWGHDANVFINDGDGTFTRLNRSWSVMYERDVEFFDYDGDQDDDIYFLQDTSGLSRLYRNDGNLVFSEVTAPAGGFPRDWSMGTGDFNTDGRDDLVFTNGKLWMSTGSALVDTTALLIDGPVGRLSMGQDICFADLDNDGDLDVYGQFRQFLNQGILAATVVADAPARGAAAALEQNFPNPFNPSTTIRYRVGTGGRVTLAVYNVAGQLVRTLVNELRHPGASVRTVVWDGHNDGGERVASGVYLCRLVAPGISQTRKLVLLK